jgi:hypothetical protein
MKNLNAQRNLTGRGRTRRNTLDLGSDLGYRLAVVGSLVQLRAARDAAIAAGESTELHDALIARAEAVLADDATPPTSGPACATERG